MKISVSMFLFFKTVCFYYFLSFPTEANVVQFLQSVNVEEIFQNLGPSKLLSVFFNQTSLFSNDQCLKDISSYRTGLQKGEIWAKKLLDASSKLPSGMMDGNVIDFGRYDECMSVEVNKNGSKIIGNHCIYTLYFSYKNRTLTVNPILSICLPQSCSENDLSRALHKKIEDDGGYPKYQLLSDEVSCSTTHTESYYGAIVVITICSVVVLILIIATILDSFLKEKIQKSKLLTRICEFSMKRSFLNIINMKNNSDSISVLHGLRVLSTLSIVTGHSVLIKSLNTYSNPLQLIQVPPYLMMLSTFILFAIETFFTISGFLVSYIFFKKYVLLTKQFNLWSYYLHRYIRLTPAIAATIIISIYVAPLLRSGPKWETISNTFAVKACKTKWWSIILYVNNIFYKDNYCLIHLWSTAVDMQLFVISPIILYPLFKKPKLGLPFLFLLILMTILISAAITAINHYPFFVNYEMGVDHMMEMFKNSYIPTYTRASPWLIGVFLGYAVNISTKDLTRKTIISCWLLTIASFLFCLIGMATFYQTNYRYNVIWESIFTSLSRPIWSLGISWIIFASIRGYGGIVTKFLSNPLFYPLSRLSFCIYLVHLTVEGFHYQTTRIPLYFGEYSMITGCIVDVVLSVILACFWSIVFELPAQILEKIMLKKN